MNSEVAHHPLTHTYSNKISAASTIEYFGLFDPLRALLAVAVFLSHSGLLPHSLENLGGFAVQVFFALSGFLVGGLLLESSKHPSYWRNIPRFYFNRCVRIWVPYFLLIACYILLVIARGYWSEEFEKRLIPLLTYTHNWANYAMGLSEAVRPINHAWSLAVEEQFYLFCPLIIGFIRSRILLITLMLGLALALSLLVDVHYYTAIFCGVAAAALHQITSIRTWSRIRWVSLVVGTPLLIVLLFTGHHKTELTVVLASVMIVVGLSKNHIKTPTFYLLGAMSYSFYLFHWLGLYLATPVAELAGSHFIYLKAAIGFALAVGISYASVKFIEWPLLSRRNEIATRAPLLVPLSALTAILLTTSGIIWLTFAS